MAGSSYECIDAVSHELRTPLSGLRGYVDLLLSGATGPVPDEHRTALAAINQCSHRLETVTENLLLLAEAQTTGLRLVRTEVDLAPVLHRVRGLLATLYGTVEVCVAAGVPAPVPADPGRLERALVNIVGNAVKFSPAGGSVRVHAGRDGTGVVVTVADQGIGIPAGEQPRVFQPLFTASNAVARRLNGAGLGLVVARLIARAHGGQLVVGSVQDAGTTVRLVLPLS
ncbi:MAG TPA: HAMP domain-containing sensor histidine kinase [Rugosimonospora sp.]|nr:HAMP domain-containing sensor histidine kinase [Rugosimonospora sp.]